MRNYTTALQQVSRQGRLTSALAGDLSSRLIRAGQLTIDKQAVPAACVNNTPGL